MKRICPLLSLLLLFVAFSSCKKSDDNGIKPDSGINLVFTAAEQQKAAADNAFTFDLFKKAAAGNTDGSNLFLSPLSVSLALSMTSNGANGQTLDAMKKTLDFEGFTQDEINSYNNKLITELPKLDANTTLKFANSIWYKQGFDVLPAFLQTNTNSYNAKIQALDFSNPSAPTTINNWVSDQTNGKIPKIVDQISGNDIMFLINAIYFKSTWATKFDASNTSKMPFTLPDNSQVSTDFMRSGEYKCNGYTDDNLTLLEMPYTYNKYSMVILMPASGKSLNDAISTLDADTWKGLMAKMTSSTVDLSVPKFKFSYSIDLVNTLSDLGMGIAFTREADFTKINAAGGLQITDVKHKAYVAVDESGTEAAAATSVTVTTSAVLSHQVIVNRPFIFVIREMNTGLILFAGTMNNPQLSGS